MDSNLLSSNYEDEEFIDMEVTSSSNQEFEFQMASSRESVTTSSPADELFYKGKLLPLHLPPRLQMVKTLLQNTKFKQSEPEKHQKDEDFITFSTPMTQSFNISPSESCRVSSELTPDEYFFEWSTELTGFINDRQKIQYYYPWSKKLKLIKNSSITQKLKASRSYIKSLFNKSVCASNAKQIEEPVFGQIEARKYTTLANVLKGIEENGNEDSFDSNCSHRKSFSGAIKRKCSSSSTSCSSGSGSGSSSSSNSFNYSNGVYELKRDSSANSELEGSIEAAIDHCKKSQQVFDSRNVLNESVFFPNSVS